MSKLNEFLALLAGRFNNAGQFRAKQESGQTFPYAEHVNTLCNDKIRNLPPDFAGAPAVFSCSAVPKFIPPARSVRPL